MAVKTYDEYIASLRKLKPTAYMFGQKLENVVDNPRIRGGINATGATYEMANSEKHRDLLTTISPFTGERINRFTLPPQSIEDLVARVKINRLLGNSVGTCHQRCTGLDCMCALSIVTYDIDKKLGTQYYNRFVEFLKHMQKNDFTANASVTDVKGDRNLAPHEQVDKDMYLRVVEKQKDGIIVRGAKVHQTGSLSAHELIVLPTRAMAAGDEDYAVAFAVPSDTKGVIHVVGRNTMDTREIEGVDCGNVRFSKYCPTVIYDDVFVPWERVFLCGEWAFAMPLVYNFAYFHRHTAASYRVPMSEMMVGMAQAMAEYNGVDKATHIIEKVTDLVIYVNMLKSLSRAACVDYVVHGGIPTPNPVITNMAKYYFASNFHRCVEMVQDVSGGLLSTAPTYADFSNPEIGGFIEKYLGGVAGATAEQRLRMLQFIRRILCQEIEVLAVQGEGSFQAQRMTIYLESRDEIQRYKSMVEKEAGITPP